MKCFYWLHPLGLLESVYLLVPDPSPVKKTCSSQTTDRYTIRTQRVKKGVMGAGYRFKNRLSCNVEVASKERGSK
jgi:hypothetical protein